MSSGAPAAFIPMKGEVFVVVVALVTTNQTLANLRAFVTTHEQMNYHRNVCTLLFAWRASPIFDRGGDNCDVESIP